MKKFLYEGKLFDSISSIEDYVGIEYDGYWGSEPLLVDVVEYGLVNGRHDIPVNKFIYDNINNVLDFGALEIEAHRNIVDSADVIVIYVTGLTSATIAAINVAKSKGYKSIILKHYDRDSGNYLSQWVY